ncbi:hypothetical protein HO173_003292 [Letharia columbiana]|uniref:Tc1-like transposase DDE domain-containing protein n=1 Tax=Letharia columbiana TaxID=112416 RepID=A0A8H6L7U9_9LECA|nr:uncharacterized protein HO173_003292 [Letharia columbiana]KAF6238785.1 hypothetical protein HO173_003292 [Letharia columbiana]
MKVPYTPTRNPPLANHEAITRRKAKFFKAFDSRAPGRLLQDVCYDKGIEYSTGKTWLRRRRIQGSPSTRRSGKHRPGRTPKIPTEPLQKMVDPAENPVRREPFLVQLEHFGVNTSERTLQRSLRARTNDAQLYKCAQVKTISESNLKQRREYGARNLGQTVEDLWQYVVFTDEAHYSRNAIPQDRVLRERGTRYDVKNLQELPNLEPCSVHVSGSISWHHKEITIYHDENDPPDVKIPKPRKPIRRPKRETTPEYEQRVEDWKESLPHDPEIKESGNSMTQNYYVDKLLPGHIEKVHHLRTQFGRGILMEDGDGSHGKKSGPVGRANQLREANWIETLEHPAQSHDLNPKEGIWNMHKARVHRRRRRNNLTELIQVIFEEFKEIIMYEVRARIA